MMSKELGFGSTEPNEYRSAFATLAAFVTIGFLPLLVYAYDLVVSDALTWSTVMTGIAFPRGRSDEIAVHRSALVAIGCGDPCVGGLAAGARMRRRRPVARRGVKAA